MFQSTPAFLAAEHRYRVESLRRSLGRRAARRVSDETPRPKFR